MVIFAKIFSIPIWTPFLNFSDKFWISNTDAIDSIVQAEIFFRSTA